MFMDAPDGPAFDRLGPAVAQSPVIVSVPHAGRVYPANLSQISRYGAGSLIGLEDRYVDLLAAPLADLGHTVLIARTPRAIIDLNRDETDYDPAMLSPPHRVARALSAKVRGGLGLVPRRTATLGEIWRGGLPVPELERRITSLHRPYHAAIAAAMDAAVARFGAAILIDLHSMPPLPDGAQGKAPALVIGDRFGRTCHGRFASRAAGLGEVWGLRTAFNVPYAGGHILHANAAPQRGRHAIQVELDRSLYLDAALDRPGPGLCTMQGFVAGLADALADEIIAPDFAIAAE